MEKGTVLKSALSLILLIFLFAGCSGKPSQSTIEELYVKNAKKNSGFWGQITDIKNFSVKDGLMKDNVTYIADVSYDLVFKMNFDDAVKLKEKDVNMYVPHGRTRHEQAEVELSLGLGRKQFGAGDKISQDDKVKLIKKDKGWSLE